MATPLSEERDLTNIDRLRIGALHVEPPFADEDLLDEITALESELERLRARNVELEGVLRDVEWVREDLMYEYPSLLGLVYTCGAAKDALAEVDRLRARNVELVAVLRSVEWKGPVESVETEDGYRTARLCPRCLGDRLEDHAPDCALDAALRASNE